MEAHPHLPPPALTSAPWDANQDKLMTMDYYDDTYTEIRFVAASQGSGKTDICMLLFSAPQMQQRMPVVVSRSTYKQIMKLLNDRSASVCNLALRLADRLILRLVGIRLLPPKNGEMKALIDFLTPASLTGERKFISLSCDLPEALALVNETGCRLHIKISLLAAMAISDDTKETGFRCPLGSLPDEFLRASMEEAVANENYELASLFRDEINHRLS